jgi:hypothetical protein
MAYIGKQPTPVPLTASDLDDDIISLAKMAGGTDGNLITYDASGNPVAVATGNDGQVLTSAGAGAPCLFEAAAGGGKVLQVVTGTSSSSNEGTETTFQDTGLNVTITPAATSSKIFVTMSTTGNIGSSGEFTYFTLERQISGGSDTNIGDSTLGLCHMRADAVNISPTSFHVYDAPSTTAAVTYEVQRRVSGQSGGIIYQNVKSNITAIEIGA